MIRTILVFVLAVAAAIIVYYHFERPEGGERQAVELPESRLPMTAVMGAGGDTSLVVGGRMLKLGVSLINDSRCPTGAECIRAGDGRVEVWLRGAGPNKTGLLSTDKPKEIALGPLRVVLTSLTPHPAVDRRIGNDEYRAALRISRASAHADTTAKAAAAGS